MCLGFYRKLLFADLGKIIRYWLVLSVKTPTFCPISISMKHVSSESSSLVRCIVSLSLFPFLKSKKSVKSTSSSLTGPVHVVCGEASEVIIPSTASRTSTFCGFYEGLVLQDSVSWHSSALGDNNSVHAG